MNHITFPKLGLNFQIDPTAFHIGTKPIYWYAIMIVTGFILAVLFCAATAKKRGVSSDTVIDVAIWGLIAGIIGARIYYVIFDFDSFRSNPADIFKIWEGGLAIYGGIIGAVISTAVYCKIKKLHTLQVFDVCVPGLLIGQAIGRYGNFFNAEVYGKATESLLGMSINGGAPVHPLFFYESVWNILGFLLLILLRDKKTRHGQVFFGYLLWYSLGRLVLEGMRQSQYILYLIPGQLGISQLVAFLLICGSIVGFILLKMYGAPIKAIEAADAKPDPAEPAPAEDTVPAQAPSPQEDPIPEENTRREE